MLEQYEDCLISSEADNCAGERRFLWHVDGAAFDGKGRTGSASEAGAAVGTGMRSKFGNHQVNYSATKYIKPWRTGSKSQQLPPAAGHSKNSGKGGKNTKYA